MLISIVLAMDVVIMTAMVTPYNPDKFTSMNIESGLLAPQIGSSRVIELPKPKGVFFFAADLIISDEGNGDVGVLAEAYMEVPVDEAHTTVYLDQWDEDTGRWRQVIFYDAGFYLKDYPDGITEPEVGMTSKSRSKGYYYRPREVLGAVLNERFEGLSPTTAGVLAK